MRAFIGLPRGLIALCALGAAWLAPDLAGATSMRAAPPAISIDVSHLVEQGLGPEAEWLTQDLPPRLRTALGGRAPAGSTLRVKIDHLTLGQSGGGGTDPFGATSARDEIGGVAEVVGPGGKVLGSYPLFTSLIAYTGGSIWEVGTERARVATLADAFAHWLPGQMGL